MDKLAINSVLPVDTAAPQGMDGNAAVGDGQSFGDALSGLMGKHAAKQGDPVKDGAGEDPAMPTDALPEDAVATVDTTVAAAELAFMLTPLNPALARAASAEDAADAAGDAIGLDTAAEGKPLIAAEPLAANARLAGLMSEHPDGNLEAVPTADAASTAEDLGIAQATRDTKANATPFATALAQNATAKEGASSERSASLNRPALDQRQTPPQSVAPRADASQEARSGERLAAVETASQNLSTQQLNPSATQAQEHFNLPAATTAAATVQTAAAELIAPRVGASAWSEAMGNKIVMMASDSIQHAELKLNPEGLGPLQVVLSIDDGAANVQFLAHDPQVREALQSALPKLQEMLTSAGFSLERVSIDSGSANNRGNRENADAYRQAYQPAGDQASSEGEPMPVSRIMVQALPGRIDTFA